MVRKRDRMLQFVRDYLPVWVSLSVGLSGMLAVWITLRPPSRDALVAWVVAFAVLFAVATVASFCQQRIANAEKAESERRASESAQQVKELHSAWTSQRIERGEKEAVSESAAAPEQPHVIAHYRATEADPVQRVVFKNYGAPAFDIRVDEMVFDKYTVKFDGIEHLDREGERSEWPSVYEGDEYSLVYGRRLWEVVRSAYWGENWQAAQQRLEDGEEIGRFFQLRSWTFRVRYLDAGGREHVSVHRLEIDVQQIVVLIFDHAEF